jgi:hypothetical protein
VIKKTEKYYVSRVQTTAYKYIPNKYITEKRKRTTYWLFWIVPIFMYDEPAYE